VLRRPHDVSFTRIGRSFFAFIGAGYFVPGLVDLNCDVGRSLNDLCPEAMPDQFQYARLTLSLLKIISGRSYDVIRIKLAW